MGLTGDPKGEKPENRVASRCRVLSIFPGDWGGATSRFVASMVGVEFVDVMLVEEGGMEIDDSGTRLCMFRFTLIYRINHVGIRLTTRGGVGRPMRYERCCLSCSYLNWSTKQRMTE